MPTAVDGHATWPVRFIYPLRLNSPTGTNSTDEPQTSYSVEKRCYTEKNVQIDVLYNTS